MERKLPTTMFIRFPVSFSDYLQYMAYDGGTYVIFTNGRYVSLCDVREFRAMIQNKNGLTILLPRVRIHAVRHKDSFQNRDFRNETMGYFERSADFFVAII
jgi:hypothetical protein